MAKETVATLSIHIANLANTMADNTSNQNQQLNLINQHLQKIDEKLDLISIQTTKTNGRVTVNERKLQEKVNKEFFIGVIATVGVTSTILGIISIIL